MQRSRSCTLSKRPKWWAGILCAIGVVLSLHATLPAQIVWQSSSGSGLPAGGVDGQCVVMVAGIPAWSSCATGATGISGATNHGLMLATAATTGTSLGVATNGQLPIGSTGANPVLATITGTANQVSVINGAGSITLAIPTNPTLPGTTTGTFSGNLTGNVTGAITGNADTATALAANGANCSAGQFPLGVNAAGAAESCTALPTTISGTTNQITASASTGSITLSTPQNLDTAAAVQFGRLGLGVAAPGTPGMIAATAGANNVTMMVLKRNTDTSPTGNFLDLQNAAGTGLWTVDITGALSAGTIPGARVSGNITGNAGTASALAANPADCAANQFATTIAANGDLTCAQPTFSNLSGTAASAQLPNPTTSAGGRVQAKDCTGTGHVLAINTDSTVTCSADAGAGGGLGDPGANGLVVRTSPGTTTARTITGTSNQVIVTDGTGVSGNPTLATPQDIATSSAVRFGQVGLGEAPPASAGMIAATGGTNNITLLRLKRNTDTSPTGTFLDLQNAAGTGLWTVDITGSLTAGTVPGARVSGNISGNAGTASALAANGSNCSAGQFPLGVDAAGAAESCTALPTTITGTTNQVTASASTGAVTLSIPSNAQLSVAKLTNLTSNGFVKTSGGDGTLSVDTSSFLTTIDSQTGPAIALTRGAGIGGSSSGNTITLTTASGEADFLASGALTCGASTQGKAQVHTTPLQYCDNAATPTLQYAAYGTSTGLATAGDSATAFFTTGQLEAARGGTGLDTSGSTGVAQLSSGTWSVSTAPTIASFTNATHNHTNAAGGGTLAEAALALTDVTMANASTSAHGFLKKLSNVATEFMNGQGNWATPAGGGNVSNTGTPVDNQLAVWTSATVLEGVPALTYTAGVFAVGEAGVTLGKVTVSGNTSGTITIQPQAAAGTYNFNLPTGAGSAGQPLLSGGGGSAAMTFGTLGVGGGGTGLTAGTSGGILGFTASGTLASSAALTAGSVVIGGGAGATPSGSTGHTYDATSILTRVDHCTSVSTNTTLGAHNCLLVDTTSGNVTITLPAAASGTNSRHYEVYKTVSANTLTLAPNGTNTINGVNSNKTTTAQFNGFIVNEISSTGWITATGVVPPITAVDGGTGVDSSASSGIAHVASGTWTFSPIVTADITDAQVTLAKMANIATASIMGRNTAGTGVPEVLSAATTKTLLSLNNVDNTADVNKSVKDATGLVGTEAAAPAGATNVDKLYPDSTAHRWKMNNNNGGAQVVAANPMTAAGDLIYGGASGVETRLAAGTGFLYANGASAPTLAKLARGISFDIGDPGGAALTVASTTTAYVTVPFACTISAYNLLVDAGTITVKFWKVATGTAIPTSSNSISTAGVGIASGTAIHSTTVSDFTTTAVAANDIMAMNVTAVATAKFVQGVLQCDQ